MVPGPNNAQKLGWSGGWWGDSQARVCGQGPWRHRALGPGAQSRGAQGLARAGGVGGWGGGRGQRRASLAEAVAVVMQSHLQVPSSHLSPRPPPSSPADGADATTAEKPPPADDSRLAADPEDEDALPPTKRRTTNQCDDDKRRLLVAYKSPLLYCVGRDQITALMRVPRFGSYCTGSNDLWKNKFFDLAAQVARTYEKKTDVISKVWSVQGDAWLQTALNLQPRVERPNLECVADVYDYKEAPSKTLVVDFAFNKVGGGCFGNGFVQEEQIVAQSADFAAFLKGHRESLGEDNACTYEGVYMDIWWDREQAAHKGSVDFDRVQKCPSKPFTIIAVDAPMMKWKMDIILQTWRFLPRKRF